MLDKASSKENIIKHFHLNVLGRHPLDVKSEHKGSHGHWLERSLGGEVDSDGNADLNGYECKVESNKVSWGDWGAPYRIYCDKSYQLFSEKHAYKNRWVLCKALGVERIHDKDGIYFSMSGKHIPKYINDQTFIGLSLVEENKDISIKYNFSKDKRDNKNILTPDEFKRDNLVIYKWYGTNESFNNFKNDVINNRLPVDVTLKGLKASVSLEERIRRKFGIHGVVVGLHDKSRGFYGLKFLKSITYFDWLSFFKERNVIYDTALTSRNKRPYNQWRSSKQFMETLVEDIYIP